MPAEENNTDEIKLVNMILSPLQAPYPPSITTIKAATKPPTTPMAICARLAIFVSCFRTVTGMPLAKSI